MVWYKLNDSEELVKLKIKDDADIDDFKECVILEAQLTVPKANIGVFLNGKEKIPATKLVQAVLLPAGEEVFFFQLRFDGTSFCNSFQLPSHYVVPVIGCRWLHFCPFHVLLYFFLPGIQSTIFSSPLCLISRPTAAAQGMSFSSAFQFLYLT